MEIKYTTVIDEKGEIVILRVTEDDPCCEQMAGFMDNESYDLIPKSDKELNPVLFRITVRHGGDEGWEYDYFLSFCPFCGKAITTKEKKRILRRKITKIIPQFVTTDFTEEEI